VTEEPHRYFFLRMQKTAGTALRRRLVNHFGEAAVYPSRAVDGADVLKLAVSIDYLQERLAARGDQIRVIAGHFPLCTTELIEGRYTTLTLLREPVERTLSFLRHTRENTPAVRDLPLEEIYDDEFRFHSMAHNHMTKMLSLRPAEMKAWMLTRVEFTHDHLERAKEALAGIDAVGLQEHFEDFCAELTARFGWRLGEPVTGVNATRSVEVPQSLRARIVEDNAMDVELYEFARQLLHDAGRPRARQEPVAVTDRSRGVGVATAQGEASGVER
jgi:hypothetical protein